jgi:hypothetical protein
MLRKYRLGIALDEKRSFRDRSQTKKHRARRTASRDAAGIFSRHMTQAQLNKRGFSTWPKLPCALKPEVRA